MDGLLIFPGDTKLALSASEGKLIIGGDDCCAFVIAIWNSNSAKDDNFKVILNGTEIGTIDNNANACTGRIFATNPNIDETTLAFDGNCGPPCGGSSAFQSTIEIDPSLLIEGINTLRIESIQDNNNGNFGAVRVMIVTRIDKWTSHRDYILGSYSFPDGVGQGQDYTFSYP